MKVRPASLLLLALLWTVPGLAQPRASQQELEEALTCQCGCGLTVHACNHLQCGSGEPIKNEIAQRLGAGEDAQTILAAFRTRYGEKVLSAPTFNGFNWFAWLTPFVAVAAGAVAVLFVIRRWARAPQPAVAGGAPAAADDPLRQRLARELAELDREV